jgi:hypothetical protein
MVRKKTHHQEPSVHIKPKVHENLLKYHESLSSEKTPEPGPFADIERRFAEACRRHPTLKPKIDGHERMEQHIDYVEKLLGCKIP